MRPAFARLKPEQLITVHAYFFSPSFPLYVSFAKRFLCCHRFLPPLARSWVPGTARTPAPPEQRGQDARIPDPRSRAKRGWEPAGGMVISSLLPRLSLFYRDTGDTCSLLPHPQVSGPALHRLARASRRGGSPVPRDLAGEDRDTRCHTGLPQRHPPRPAGPRPAPAARPAPLRRHGAWGGGLKSKAKAKLRAEGGGSIPFSPRRARIPSPSPRRGRPPAARTHPES